MDITVTIKCPDLVAAATQLSMMLAGHTAAPKTLSTQGTSMKADEPDTDHPSPKEMQKVAVTPSDLSTAPAVPVVPTTPVTPAAPAITAEQVAKAGAELITTNPQILGALNELLKKYGVAYAQQLKGDQIPAFAADMRSLGAKI